MRSKKQTYYSESLKSKVVQEIKSGKQNTNQT